MNGPAATILIPTFDHGPLVRLALESALAQTVTEIEVFVVGDGVPDVTREIVGEIATSDPRVRFFDNAKGPRRGEIHRHAALAEARGRIVLYHTDDDLWLPEHVETMLALLDEADFASAVFLGVGAGGPVLKGGDFGRVETRQEFLRGKVGIGLSTLGHTLDAYRRLRFGWRTTPEDMKTDRYFWEQFVSDFSFRGAGSTRLTVLNLGGGQHLAPAERLAEMSEWWGRVCDPAARAAIHAVAFSLAHARAESSTAKVEKLRTRNAKRTAQIEDLRAREAKRLDQIAELRASNATLKEKLETAHARAHSLSRRTWFGWRD